ncbi:hypothetical protein DXG01_011725 [Tephrocybe rancida]|nr:hypothetical protein DXG01_011725 [Tephrocybe rancida]
MKLSLLFITGLLSFASAFPAPEGDSVLEVRQFRNRCPSRRRASPFYRLYNSAVVDHFYTVNTAELSAAGYTSEGVSSYIFTSSQPGTVPLYRLYSSGATDHFYTTSASERNSAIGQGYQSEGIAGYIFPSRNCGGVPFYRLYNSANTDHFYTTSASERNTAIASGGYTTFLMSDIQYRKYLGEPDLPHVMDLVQSELSEPYVIYTFRYFLHHCKSNDNAPIGVIVCKQSMHKDLTNRGYIAMLSVSKNWRKRGIASSLVRNSIEAMKQDDVDEIILETEYDNHAALSLYESLGFIREKRLHRFYLNGKDAFRLVLAVPRTYSDDSSDTSGSSPPMSSTLSSRRHMLSHRAIRISPYSDDDNDDEVSSR